MRVLLLTPPMTQLNTPYPATPYLTGFLREHAPDVEVAQADLALGLFLRLYSRAGVDRIVALAAERTRGMRRVPRPLAHLLENGDRYVETVEPVVQFLQGRDPSLALRIVGRELLPEGARFQEVTGAEPGLAWAFGALGVQDQAKYLASLYVDDLADAIRAWIDPRFELSRYAERLAASAPTFDSLQEALVGEATFVDESLDALARELVPRHRPDVVGLTVPFPGNLYGALRIARAIKATAPAVRVVLGGGYVNTELRDLRDARIFDFVDYITLDDGERPLLSLLEHLREPASPLFRTFVREGDAVVLQSDTSLHDIPQAATGTPTYEGLPLGSYVSLLEMLNPMHRLWSDGRWNKLTVAHGCYWKKCTFCDVSLDYIGRYERTPADTLVDRIEALVAETGQRGFHFVDEAAPPAGASARSPGG